MPNPDLIRLTRQNYLSAVRALVGTELFRHIYVRDKYSGREFDATDDGRNACAYVVSGLVSLFGLIDRPHATVATTIEKLIESGWEETKVGHSGDIAHWPNVSGHAHLGFLIDDKTCISNSEEQRVPIRHSIRLNDGREPDRYFTHIAIRH